MLQAQSTPNDTQSASVLQEGTQTDVAAGWLHCAKIVSMGEHEASGANASQAFGVSHGWVQTLQTHDNCPAWLGPQSLSAVQDDNQCVSLSVWPLSMPEPLDDVVQATRPQGSTHINATMMDGLCGDVK